MELTAALRGLEKLTEPCAVTIYTDSQYVKNGMEKWVQGWIKRGWKTAGGDTVKNLEVWQALNQEASKHEVSWVWVKGHAGHPGNERADALANMGVDSCS
jgi:ribonuclease HI